MRATASRGRNLGIRLSRVLPPNGIVSTQTRKMLSACRTFPAFELRADYRFTLYICDLHAVYVHERITHCLRKSLFKKNPLPRVLRAAYVISALSVLTRHFLSSTVQTSDKSEFISAAVGCWSVRALCVVSSENLLAR